MTSVSSTKEFHSAYPPLSEVRNSLRIKWYRSPISHQRLKVLSERSDRQGWKQAGGHYLLFIALVLITVWLWAMASWVAFVLSLWCLGFVATFFKGTAAHELGHGTVFKTRRLNRVFLYAVCMISWWDPFDYGASHTYHHRYTTHPEGDRENVLPLSPSLQPWLMLQVFTINLFTAPGRTFNKGGFLWSVYLTARSALGIPNGSVHIASQEWMQALHAEHQLAFKQSVIWSRVLLGFHAGVLLVAILTGWWVLPLVITMPSFIANFGSYFLGITQHCGLPENVADFRKNTRSIKLHPFVGFLYWHMNFHTEHHMYAGVPCYNLSALSKELAADLPEPKNLFETWREMRLCWHRQQQDSNYAIDIAVPNTEYLGQAIDQNKMGADNREGDIITSIGELAPKGWEDPAGH